jgi:hypothetical protein
MNQRAGVSSAHTGDGLGFRPFSSTNRVWGCCPNWSGQKHPLDTPPEYVDGGFDQADSGVTREVSVLRPRTRGRLLALGSAVLLAIGVTTAAAAPASAANCSYDSATHHLTVTLAPTDNDLWVQAAAPYLQTAGGLCVFLSQVESVTLDVSANPAARVVFDLSTGPLGRGYTDEVNDSSEIEFAVNGLGPLNAVVVHGAAGSDGVRLGQYTNKVTGVTTGQLNLNAIADAGSPDVDVSYTSFPGSVRFYGHDGNDTLSAAGVGVLLTAPYALSTTLDGGAGSNQVTGGNGNDLLYLHLEATRTGVESIQGGGGDDDELIIGSDTANYPASITLDGVANDGLNCPGTSCDGDNVGADIEQVVGSGASETIVGNAGSDYLLGGGGNDHLNGKGGQDYLECDGGTARGAKGSDTIEPAEDDCVLASGGAGADVVSFEQYSYPVVVTLDDLANDGSSFLNLNVRSDVEAVIGTPFADYLVGNGRRNDLSGDYGRDHISGGGGSDVLRGGNNNDVINGDAGADSLFGGPGDDSLDGGSGVDHCDQESGSGTSMNCEG